ncbi:MAG: polysaccharide pyruvyl transferase family protein [Pseudobutyrivibrio ruminis]|nr:polysaccharide pyruvyl transferase family protein [Pseudobutyrivibrio ruminis]
MKYGVIIYNYEDIAIKCAGYNLGDPVQTIAVLHLYKQMGIPENEIVHIGMQHLKDYNGEYVILPIIGVGIVGDYAPPYSERIIPIFISSHFVLDELTQEQISYLNHHAPIGCRDEWSLNTMRKYNIPSYLSGCITVLMHPKMDTLNCRNDGKIWAIDVPEFIKPELEKHFDKENIIYGTHLVPFSHDGAMTAKDTKDYINMAKQRIEEYRKAKLVISSRMHAIIPAMTAGTPVIGVFENISYRFSWLDKYIPLYTESDIDKIDWTPKSVEIQQYDLIYKVFSKRISDIYNKYADYMDISLYYEERHKAQYGNRYKKIINRFIDKEKKVNYMIFGCGLIGAVAYKIIQEEYPYANFLGAIDNYVEGEWKGKPVYKPNKNVIYPDTKIIIATYSGKESALNFMKSLNYKENSNYCYIATTSG